MSIIREINIVQPTSAFGDLVVTELRPVFQLTFEYTVDNQELLTQTLTAGGTATQASGMAVVGTSTTTASDALLVSKQQARYRAGLGGLLRFTALFTAPVAATEQYAGLMDEAGSSQAFKNGYGIGYNGTTFGFHRWQNDTLTTVAQANWDDPLDGTGASGMTLDQTKMNVWAIAFQYLGAGTIKLLVEDDDTGQFVVVHIIDYANANVTPSVHNPNFRYTMWVDNKATVSDIVMKSGSAGFFIQGMTSFIELQQPHFSSGLREKTTVTTEAAIFTIRNKTTYAGKTNFVDIVLELASGSIEANAANNLGSVRIVKNATLGGTPSYADIEASDSVVEIDVAGTTVSGGKALPPIQLAGKNDAQLLPLSLFRMIINPGETITLAGTSANSATIDASILWKELF